jgi:hypothetical protein
MAHTYLQEHVLSAIQSAAVTKDSVGSNSMMDACFTVVKNRNETDQDQNTLVGVRTEAEW